MRYMLLSSDLYEAVEVDHATPIYIDNDSELKGFDKQCVKDLSIGTDGSKWALDCNPDYYGNYGVI